MSLNKDLLEKIEMLEVTGQQFADQLRALGANEGGIDPYDFHRWRVEASKLLFSSLGPGNYYYEFFWKSVTRPELDHLQGGLRLLATVRSELQAVLPQEQTFPGRDQEAVEEVLATEF